MVPAPGGPRSQQPVLRYLCPRPGPLLLQILLLIALALCHPAVGGENATTTSPANATQPEAEAEVLVRPLHGAVDPTEKQNQMALAIDESISVFLFGFLVVAIGMQYLVNYKDADIRSSIYKMISTTVTIFCGVVITQALFVFLEEQVLLSPPPRGFGLEEVGPRLAFALRGAVFLGFLVLINVCCWLLWESKILLYAARNLLAHLCAFGGIRAVDIMLEQCAEQKSLGLVVGTALGFMAAQVLLMFVANRGRKYFGGKARGGHGESEAEAEEEEEKPVWMEAAKEAEDEATVLVSGFCCAQVVCYLVMEEIIEPEVEPGAGAEFAEFLSSSPHEPFKGLGIWTATFLVLVFIATYLRAILGLSGFLGRIMGNFHSFLTMTFAFCLLRLSNWIAIEKFHKHSDLAYVFSALVVSVSCIVAMIIIDRVADGMLSRSDDHKVGICGSTSRAGDSPVPRNPPDGEAEIAGGCEDLTEETTSSDAESDSLEHSPHHHTRAEKSEPEILSRRWRKRIHKNLYSHRNNEQALRTVIAGLGIVIGLSWEIAFSVAEETIATQMNAFKAHPVLMKNVVAMVLVAFILPAWMKFIAPMSLMHRDWHQMRIDQELEAEAAQTDLVPDLWMCVKRLACALCCCCCGGCPSRQDAREADDSGSPRSP